MWLSLTFGCLHFHGLSVFYYVALKRNRGGKNLLRSTCWGTPWSSDRLSSLGPPCQVGTVTDSSSGLSSSACAQAVKGLNRFPHSSCRQCLEGKGRARQLHWATRSRCWKGLRCLVCSLQTQSPLLCPLHLNAHLPSVLPSAPFWSLFSSPNHSQCPPFHSSFGPSTLPPRHWRRE